MGMNWDGVGTGTGRHWDGHELGQGGIGTGKHWDEQAQGWGWHWVREVLGQVGTGMGRDWHGTGHWDGLVLAQGGTGMGMNWDRAGSGTGRHWDGDELGWGWHWDENELGWGWHWDGTTGSRGSLEALGGSLGPSPVHGAASVRPGVEAPAPPGVSRCFPGIRGTQTDAAVTAAPRGSAGGGWSRCLPRW